MCFFVLVLVCFFWVSSGKRSRRTGRFWKECNTSNNQIPEIASGNTVHSQTIQRNNFRFCRTVRDRTLFLTHPTYGNECSTSEDTQNSPRSRCRIFKVPSKVSVLDQSQSTMLCRITHMALLSVITRVMNVRDHTSQAFVTSSGPFCDRSCQFVYRPKNVRSTNSGQISAFHDDLRANF